VEINGVRRGGSIVGTAHRLGESEQAITIRLTRRRNLPAADRERENS